MSRMNKSDGVRKDSSGRTEQDVPVRLIDIKQEKVQMGARSIPELLTPLETAMHLQYGSELPPSREWKSRT